MCRHFRDTPLDPFLVDRLLDQATRAPSAGHTQGWSFLVVESPDDRDRFWSATSAPERIPLGVLRAPAVVVPLCSRGAYETRYARPDKVAFEWDVPYWLVDVSMATMLLLLGAENAGLGALFFRLHRPASELRDAFSVPDEWEPIGAVALGYRSPPEPEGAGRRRRPLAEVVHRGRW